MLFRFYLKKVITVEKEYAVEIRDNGNSKSNYTTVINGFDVYAKNKAKKIQSFQINIVDEYPYSIKHKFYFRIVVKFNANCASLECEKFNNIVDYYCNIFLVVLDLGEGGTIDIINVQNRENMKKEAYNRKHSRFSRIKNGSGWIRTAVCLFRLRNSTISTGSSGGSIIWSGRNKDANNEKSILIKSIDQ